MSISFFYRQAFVPIRPLPPNVDLSGQTALVTGANTGIGLETAKHLIQHKISRIIIAARSVQKGDKAKDDLKRLSTRSNIEVWALDHDSFESITEFGKRVEGLDRLDIAILNVGNLATKYTKSPSGHESTLQVNHLGTSLLSLLILPTMTKTARSTNKPSRLTITSSENHMFAHFKERHADNMLKRMDEQETWAEWERYNTSKLLNVLWTRELASRTRAADVIINTVNPGFVQTELHRDFSSGVITLFRKLIGRPPEQGGYALADAAVAQPLDTHGGYLSEQQLLRPSKFVSSAEGQLAQTRLWNETVELLRKESSADIQLP